MLWYGVICEKDFKYRVLSLLTVYSHSLEVWDAEKHLHHCAEVARVPKVFDARVTRTKHCFQFHARLLDHLPLANPRPAVVVCVVTVFRLRQQKELDHYTSRAENKRCHLGWDKSKLPCFASAACQYQSAISVLI